jgi:hypothetical protein
MAQPILNCLLKYMLSSSLTKRLPTSQWQGITWFLVAATLTEMIGFFTLWKKIMIEKIKTFFLFLSHHTSLHPCQWCSIQITKRRARMQHKWHMKQAATLIGNSCVDSNMFNNPWEIRTMSIIRLSERCSNFWLNVTNEDGKKNTFL